MTSEWEDERGKTVYGTLELWVPDTLFQYYEPSWYAKFDPKSPRLRLLPRDSLTTWIKSTPWRPLIGAVEIDLKAVSAPAGNRLSSRDPFEPGIRMEGANLQPEPPRIGFVQLDGNGTALTIERKSSRGFSGKWTTYFFGVIVRNGRELPNPHGTFCARRIGNHAPPPPNTR